MERLQKLLYGRLFPKESIKHHSQVQFDQNQLL